MFTTFLLLFLLTLIFMGAGRILAGKKGMVFAFIVALGMNAYSYWFSDSIVLNAYDAEEAPANHRLTKITKEIAQQAGMPMPDVYIIPSNSPNAFATGRSPDNAAVAATKGILSLLTDEELKGVMAHELGHVFNRDTLISTVAASVAGGLMLLSRFALFIGGNSKESWGKRLAVSIVAPLAATVVTFAISREREYEADEWGGKLTKKPKFLASALMKLRAGVANKPIEKHSPETAHLFIVNPFEGYSVGDLFSSHPPMKLRVQKLYELDAQLNQ